MNEPEAKQIAQAYGDVAEHYSFLRLDPKHAALMNFGSAIAIVYGSKFAAWKMRRVMTPSPATPTSRHAEPAQPSPMTTQQVNGVDLNHKPRDVGPELRRSNLPGIGEVEFPPDHPLISGRKN